MPENNNTLPNIPPTIPSGLMGYGGMGMGMGGMGMGSMGMGGMINPMMNPLFSMMYMN